MVLITPEQCRMARAALQLSAGDLAALAKVGRNTIVRFESGQQIKPASIEKLHDALTTAGIEFIPENGGGPGARLKRSN